MDAERNKRKGPQPREGKAKQMEGLDLESVIERARGHDAEALGEIYRRYIRRIRLVPLHAGLTGEGRRCHQRSLPQATAFHQKLRRFDTVSKLAAAGGWQPNFHNHLSSTPLAPQRVNASPLGAVMGKEERAQVRDAIAGLPENYRLPLVLRYYSELSYDEIAQQLDLRRNYVAALIFRAKQELRRKLAHRSK